MPPPRKKEGGETEKISLLILRRRGGHGDHAHHGGAWKIAYADFVTAMMAFFLLMWLLNSTNKSDKQGIADFFNRPLSVALQKGNSSSASNSIINGGGTDLMSKTSAEVNHGDNSKQQNAVLVPNATSQRSADQEDATTPGMVMPAADPTAQEKPHAETPEDAARLAALKDRLDKMIEMNAKLAQFKNQIRIDITSEGLRIQIVDAQNRPMFQTGRAELEPYAKEILDQIGVALNDVPNHISVAGHTDSAPYAGALSGYSNWELSSERANSARRELGIGGMKELKVLQVRGLADALPLDKNDLAAPANRRISILVLNKKTEDAFYRDGGRMDLSTPSQLPSAVGGRPSAGAPASAPQTGNVQATGPAVPFGGSPDNRAASPEAVVARIKAAVDATGTATAAGTAPKHGSPVQSGGTPGVVPGVTPGIAPAKASASADNTTQKTSAAGTVAPAVANVSTAVTASPDAKTVGGSIASPAAKTVGGSIASPAAKAVAGSIASPAPKAVTGAITAPVIAAANVPAKAPAQPAPSHDQQTSDFGRAQ